MAQKRKNLPKEVFASDTICFREGSYCATTCKQYNRSQEAAISLSFGTLPNGSSARFETVMNSLFDDRARLLASQKWDAERVSNSLAPASNVNKAYWQNRSPAREGTKRSHDTEPQSCKRTPLINSEKLTKTKSFLSDVLIRTGNMRSKSSNPKENIDGAI